MHRHFRAGSERRTGVAALLAGALSNQTGAAVGSLAFPLIGPLGVVVVRQLVAAAVLLLAVRPRVRDLTWRQWWPVLLLALVIATMNLSLYLSIERIGLGLAVTLEFLGPLAVALIGSRSRVGVGSAVIAGIGVVAITQPGRTTDYLGVGLALVAAACWASYILLNRTVGRRVAGLVGTATATAVSATLFVPVGIVVFLHHPPSGSAVICAMAAGVLASAVPYLADLIALRRVPAPVFGILTSVNPIFAAAIGALALQQPLGALEWGGIALVVLANVFALLPRRPRSLSSAP